MARLLTRSAITPPNGLISMVGMTDMASTVAKVVDDAVSSSTHMDMANRSMVLPNKEMTEYKQDEVCGAQAGLECLC